jgi:hypothetical protein
MRKIAFVLFGMISMAQAAPPPPEDFVADVLAGRIDPETYDLAGTSLWSLTPAEQLQWNQGVIQRFLGFDLNNGCDAANLRGGKAMMWTLMSQKAPDAATWKLNADALRARLRELDARLLAAGAKASLKAEPRVAELQKRVAVDQAARGDLFNAQWRAELPALAAEVWSALLASRLWAVDCDNTAWLQQQMKEIGWFDIEKYGAAADKDAWLLVQHADRSKPFQRETLAMLESLLADKTDPKNLAYLHDRVAMGEGRPQRYGTQGQCQPDGTWKPNESEDPAGVDARRKALGLPPIAEYALVFRDSCKVAPR